MRGTGFRGYCVLALCCATLPLTSSSQSRTDVSDQASAKAEVAVSLVPAKRKVGQPVYVHFQITNTGSIPFYIPPIIDDFGLLGGFSFQVLPPPGQRFLGSARAADWGPGPQRDILQVAATWIVLRHGDFYGATRPVEQALLPSPGKYRIVVCHNPPILSDAEKAKLRESLKFPVLLDTVKSAPAALDVVK